MWPPPWEFKLRDLSWSWVYRVPEILQLKPERVKPYFIQPYSFIFIVQLLLWFKKSSHKSWILWWFIITGSRIKVSLISELILQVARNCWYKLLESILLLPVNWNLKINVCMQKGNLKWGLHYYNDAPGYVIVKVKCVFPSWSVFFLCMHFAT